MNLTYGSDTSVLPAMTVSAKTPFEKAVSAFSGKSNISAAHTPETFKVAGAPASYYYPRATIASLPTTTPTSYQGAEDGTVSPLPPHEETQPVNRRCPPTLPTWTWVLLMLAFSVTVGTLLWSAGGGCEDEAGTGGGSPLHPL